MPAAALSVSLAEMADTVMAERPSAYTIGRTMSYERALNNEPTVKKLGRDDDYEGGWVWRTQEDAQAFIDSGKFEDRLPGPSAAYSVYGLVLPNGWDEDVSPEPAADSVHRLLHSSRIIRLTT